MVLVYLPAFESFIFIYEVNVGKYPRHGEYESDPENVALYENGTITSKEPREIRTVAVNVKSRTSCEQT